MEFFFKDKKWFENFYILNKLSGSIKKDSYPDCVVLNNKIICYNLNYFNNLPPRSFNIGILENDYIYLIDTN